MSTISMDMNKEIFQNITKYINGDHKFTVSPKTQIDQNVFESSFPVISGSGNDDTLILIRSNGTAEALTGSQYQKLKLPDSVNSVSFVSNRIFYHTLGDEVIFTEGGIDKEATKIEGNYTHCAGYSNTLALIDDDQNIILYPDYNQKETKIVAELPIAAQKLSCGDRFAVILLENGTLFVLREDGILKPVVISNRLLVGGDHFKSVSASATYFVAIDNTNAAYIFGKIGNIQEYNQCTSVLNNCMEVFAFPRHCIIRDEFSSFWSIGENESGQLALENNNSSKRTIPAAVNKDYLIGGAIGSDKWTLLLPYKPIRENYQLLPEEYYHDYTLIDHSQYADFKPDANIINDDFDKSALTLSDLFA